MNRSSGMGSLIRTSGAVASHSKAAEGAIQGLRAHRDELPLALLKVRQAQSARARAHTHARSVSHSTRP